MFAAPAVMVAPFLLGFGVAATVISATGAWAESVFLVGIGVAQVAVTASTRFTAPRGAY